MRLNLGPPPKDDTISEEGSTWYPVNEPGLIRLQITAFFTALLIAAFIALVILLTRGSNHIGGMLRPIVLLFIILVIPIHEFLHAVCFKGRLTSKRVIFGFYPKVLGFYAHYIGQVSWYRYIVIAVFPFLILTVIPLIIVIIFNLEYPFVVEVIFANGLASAGDVVTVIIILKQVPRQSILINTGMKTYWKPVSNKPLESDVE